MSNTKESCKICHMGEIKGDRLCSPCRCSGSIKYVHTKCLFAWISCSKAERCDICHYEYKFRDVYKPNTPRVLPLSIIVKGMLSIWLKAFLVLAWYFLQIAKWTGIFYINGYFLLFSTGFFSVGILSTLNHTFICLTTGIPLAWLSQMHQCFFSQIQRKFGGCTRRIVVDSRLLLRSTVEELDTSDVSSRSSFAARPDITGETLSISGRMTDDVFDNNIGMEEHSEESSVGDGTTFSRAEITDRRVSLTGRDFSPKAFIHGIYSSTVPVMFLPAVLMVSRIIPVHIPYQPFAAFLEEVDLDYVYSRFVSFGIVFWFGIRCLSYVQKKMYSKTLKFVCIFLKIYYIILLNMFSMYLTFGLIIHYMFANILNGGVYVLDLKENYNILIRGFISLMFHMSIGYTFGMMIRNICLKFKRCLRPGLLHFIPDDEDSRIEELYEACKVNISEIIFHAVIYLCIFSMFYGFGFLSVKYMCSDVEVRLSVRNLFKLSLICKILSVLLYSNEVLSDYLVLALNRMLRFQSKLLGMENFLYNAPMERCDKARLVWCANRNKMFRRRHIKAREKRVPTDIEISKYFNTNISSDFAIFYVPAAFALRCSFILSTLVLFCYSFYAGYVSVANSIVRCVKLQRYLQGSDDIVFYSILAVLFRVSWILLYVAMGVFSEKKRFSGMITGLAKYGIVNVYVNLFYPVFGSFVLMILSNDGLNLDILRPLRLFLLLFSNTFIVETLVCGCILRSSPENYSFRMLVRELYKINAFVSVLFGAWYLYNALALVLGLSNTEFLILGVFVGYIVFVAKKVNRSIGGDRSLYRRLLDENYLIERRVVNIDEDE